MNRYLVETRSGRIEEISADGVHCNLTDGQYIVTFYLWRRLPTTWIEGDREIIAEYFYPDSYRIMGEITEEIEQKEGVKSWL